MPAAAGASQVRRDSSLSARTLCLGRLHAHCALWGNGVAVDSQHGTTELLAIIGAITGIVGAMTGIVSLVWQIITHRKAGRLVSVKATYMLPVYGQNRNEFRGDDQIGIQVFNRGGLAVAVTNYGLRLGSRPDERNAFEVNKHVLSTPLPAMVEPGGPPALFTMSVDGLRQLHSDEGIPYSQMRPWVDLGDGRRIFATNSVPLK